MQREITIAGRVIGAGRPSFVIAEAGVNHNGSIDLGRKLIDVAVEAGADAVKFQTFKADKLASASAPKAKYQIDNTGTSESQHEMLRKLELTPAMQDAMAAHCRERGILFLSTPFDADSADELEAIGVPAFKVPSGEITNIPLLKHIARKGKPMIVSTGMAYLGEVETALRAIVEERNDAVAVLHCVSNYPAADADVNLRAMATMADAFRVPIGYSDHSAGIAISLAAVALGATIIEKHFTIDRTLPGPDHVASLEPNELRDLIRGIRSVEAALGDGIKRPTAAEASTADVARRSLVAARPLAAGTVLAEDHIAILRPGTGLAPAMLPQLVGRTLRTAVDEGTLFRLEMLV
jgi:N,N'-diacetyllegionaminate synthase